MPELEIFPFPEELAEPTDPAEREHQLRGAEAEIETGRFNTHEAVRTWVAELVAERNIPRPCDQ
jgi:predicted transcriptional regulator